MIKNIKGNLLPLAFILFVTCLIFFKIFTKGLYPIPGDMLVSFYFPWYSGEWEGYDPWTTRKELLGADAVRQIYPWKEFAMNQFKKGELPLWNPYTFSGQPQAANFQTSAYYPLNVFYFLTDARNAWIILIVIQPFLGGIFMYLALRSFKISKLASVFGAMSFMFSSYLITWMENGNISHSYIWLPSAIFAINKYFEKLKLRWLLLMTIALSMSILAGHPQTAIYIFIASSLYFSYKIFESKRSPKLFLLYIISVSFALAICAIQLIQTYSFYKVSPISLPFAKEVFDHSLLPYKNLVSFFASDFFGHPANNNFWSKSYGDFTPYFGVIPLIFALWAIFYLWKDNLVKLATAISALFILSAMPGPITYLIRVLKPPLIDATTPSRFISISIFFMIILTAIGFENFLSNLQDSKFRKKFAKFLELIGFIYLVLWAFAFLGTQFLKPLDTWQINLSVTKRNLILPTLMFISLPSIILLTVKTKKIVPIATLKTALILSIFATTIVGGTYYTNKFLPVAPKKFIFPDHLLFNWLKDNAGINRFYGGGTAHIDFNFPTHYQIYGIEGYDTLRLERYAQLLASSYSGEVPKTYLRSDAVVPNEENGYRKRIFELLAVKYLLDKEDNPKSSEDWHYERFQGDNVKGYWQYSKFQIYTREPVLPRIFQTTRYYVAKNDEEIIRKIYDPSFNLQTLILEAAPPIEIDQDASPIIEPDIISYSPSQVEVKTTNNINSLLFLSDAYEKDWNVYVDSAKQPLLRAHYALRAVAVPKGNHTVIFKYEPQSIVAGTYTTLLSLAILLTAGVIAYKRKIL